MRRRLFTLEEAIALLSWLESKFAEIDAARKQALSLQERRDSVMLQVKRNGSTSHEEELQLHEKQIRRLPEKVQQVITEIAGRGIIVRSVENGLVDFPTMRDGHEVQLCWLRGEPEIKFWHTYDTGYAGRQPL